MDSFFDEDPELENALLSVSIEDDAQKSQADATEDDGAAGGTNLHGHDVHRGRDESVTDGGRAQTDENVDHMEVEGGADGGAAQRTPAHGKQGHVDARAAEIAFLRERLKKYEIELSALKVEQSRQTAGLSRPAQAATGSGKGGSELINSIMATKLQGMQQGELERKEHEIRELQTALQSVNKRAASLESERDALARQLADGRNQRSAQTTGVDEEGMIEEEAATEVKVQLQPRKSRRKQSARAQEVAVEQSGQWWSAATSSSSSSTSSTHAQGEKSMHTRVEDVAKSQESVHFDMDGVMETEGRGYPRIARTQAKKSVESRRGPWGVHLRVQDAHGLMLQRLRTVRGVEGRYEADERRTAVHGSDERTHSFLEALRSHAVVELSSADLEEVLESIEALKHNRHDFFAQLKLGSDSNFVGGSRSNTGRTMLSRRSQVRMTQSSMSTDLRYLCTASDYLAVFLFGAEFRWLAQNGRMRIQRQGALQSLAALAGETGDSVAGEGDGPWQGETVVLGGRRSSSTLSMAVEERSESMMESMDVHSMSIIPAHAIGKSRRVGRGAGQLLRRGGSGLGSKGGREQSRNSQSDGTEAGVAMEVEDLYSEGWMYAWPGALKDGSRLQASIELPVQPTYGRVCAHVRNNLLTMMDDVLTRMECRSDDRVDPELGAHLLNILQAWMRCGDRHTIWCAVNVTWIMLESSETMRQLVTYPRAVLLRHRAGTFAPSAEDKAALQSALLVSGMSASEGTFAGRSSLMRWVVGGVGENDEAHDDNDAPGAQENNTHLRSNRTVPLEDGDVAASCFLSAHKIESLQSRLNTGNSGHEEAGHVENSDDEEEDDDSNDKVDEESADVDRACSALRQLLPYLVDMVGDAVEQQRGASDMVHSLLGIVHCVARGINGDALGEPLRVFEPLFVDGAPLVELLSEGRRKEKLMVLHVLQELLRSRFMLEVVAKNMEEADGPTVMESLSGLLSSSSRDSQRHGVRQWTRTREVRLAALEVLLMVVQTHGAEGASLVLADGKLVQRLVYLLEAEMDEYTEQCLAEKDARLEQVFVQTSRETAGDEEISRLCDAQVDADEWQHLQVVQQILRLLLAVRHAEPDSWAPLRLMDMVASGALAPLLGWQGSVEESGERSSDNSVLGTEVSGRELVREAMEHGLGVDVQLGRVLPRRGDLLAQVGTLASVVASGLSRG